MSNFSNKFNLDGIHRKKLFYVKSKDLTGKNMEIINKINLQF